MRREQAVLLRLTLVALGEPRQKLRQAGAGVPRLLHEENAFLVGVELVAAIERVLEHHVVRAVRERVEERAAIRRGLAGSDLHALALSNGVDGVLLRDVRDLVSEHAGQLGFGLDQRERAARDVHEPAGRRERVDAVGVEHDERPRQLRRRRLLGQHGADERDVLVHGRVLHHAEARADLQADVGAELDFLFLGDVQVVELLLALLGLLQPFADAAELREGGRADGQKRDDE